MKIAVASDHAGFDYKEAIKSHLQAKGHEVLDFGANSGEPSDYPKFVKPAAEALVGGEVDRGILVGGSGNGEAMAANRFRGVRCAVCWNEESARLARRHNDANAIAIGQRMMSLEEALRIVEIFLTEPFDAGRHQRRIEMLD